MSDFWVRKMKTFFQRLDIDDDGAITQKDFEDIADRFVSTGKLDAVGGAELKAKLIPVWEKYYKDPNTGEPLKLDACVDLVKSLLSNKEGRDGLRVTATELMQIYFTAIDANADGSIQADEYALFFEIIGLDRTLAPESFAAIDTNKDGQLSLEEFIAAGLEFCLGEDESSPTKLFWGPLV